MSQGNKSELVQAAESLDAELQQFERSVSEVARTPLDSRKNIARAAEILKDVVSSDERLRERVATLVNAVSAARERQQVQAEKVHARAMELQGRTEVLSGLLQRYDELGAAASQVTQRLQAFLTAAREGKSGEISLDEVKQVVSGIAERVQGLAKDAGSAEFGDIAKEAETVRQQLLSGMNKVELLQKKLS